MASNISLEESLEVVSETEREIEAQIRQLENQRRMIKGYKAKLKDCAERYGVVTMEQSPAFIIKDIKTTMKATMDAFEKLQLSTLPLLGILIDSERYDDMELYNCFIDRAQRQKKKSAITSWPRLTMRESVKNLISLRKNSKSSHPDDVCIS